MGNQSVLHGNPNVMPIPKFCIKETLSIMIAMTGNLNYVPLPVACQQNDKNKQLCNVT